MANIRLTGFDGANIAQHPLTLPDTVGTASTNQRRGRNDLRPLVNPVAISLAGGTVPSNTQSIYRMGRDTASETQYWLTWTTDADVVRGLLGDDSTERTYYTQTNPTNGYYTEPKWIDNTFALAGVPYPNSPRTLGVPKPTTLPTVTVSVVGTATTLEKRVYVWTWVTDHGEESQPSTNNAIPASGSPTDSTWHIVFNEGAPTPGTGQAWTITKRRLYRAAYTSSGVGTYQLVTELTGAGLLNGATYDDTTPTAQLGVSMETLYWAAPPTTLSGLTGMWNGMLAAFSGKSVYFCEPDVPYAWPTGYVQTVQDTIVGLAVWQQNLLVLTTGKPILITGSSPSLLTLQPINTPYSCIAKKSIVEMGYGVIWAAPEGLVLYSANGVQLLTENLYKRDDWLALVPSTLIASRWENMYVASYNSGGGRTSLMIDPQNPIGVFYSTIGFDGKFLDPITDQLFVLDTTNSQIKKWMPTSGGSALTATFKSKVFRQDKPLNFSWAQVVADSYASVVITIIADGVTRVNAQSVTSGQPFRLPSGFKAREWQIQIATTSPVQEVILATSMAELQAIA